MFALSMVRGVPAQADNEFPSWVPRWDKPAPPGQAMSAKKAAKSWQASKKWKCRVKGSPNDDSRPDKWTAKPLQVEGEDRKYLVCKGVKVTSIRAAFHLHQNPWDRKTFVDLWERIEELLSSFRGPGALQEAFVRTVTLEETLPLSEQLYDVSDLMAVLNEKQSYETSDFWKIGIQRDWSFFITDDGRIGMGAKVIQPGDVVCVLFGGDLPYVIRPLDGGHYRFLEECYVDDIMQGEYCDEYREKGLSDEWISLK